MLIKNLAMFIKDVGSQTYNILTRTDDDEPEELMGDVVAPVELEESDEITISTCREDNM